VTHAQLQAIDDDEEAAKSVRVQGLVRSIRRQKRIAFIHIADGSTSTPIHAVVQPPSLAASITNGSYVDVTGRWEVSPGKGQSHDLQVEAVNGVGLGDVLEQDGSVGENPIQKKATSAEFLRSVPHLRMRTGLGSLVTRSRAQLTRAVADYFENVSSEPAIQVHPPAITSSDCEGAGEVFTIAPATAAQLPPGQIEQQHFFGEPKYLTVSNQLHLEAYSAELGDVWCLAPTFRAEASETPRHLAEFYMLEAEFRGTSSLHEIIDHAEALIRHAAREFVESRVGKELAAYYSDPAKAATSDVEEGAAKDLETRWAAVLQDEPWMRLTYSAALQQLQTAYKEQAELFEFEPSWDGGLALEHEKWLVSEVAGNHPLVIMDYPKAQKPFYMLPNDAPADQSSHGSTEQRQTAACFDVLLPFGYAEVCGGSLREHRLEPLIATMRGTGLLKPKRSEKPSTSAAASDFDATSFTTSSASLSPTRSAYPFLHEGESLNSLQWYADLRRFGSSPHGGFGIGFDRLLAYLAGVSNIRDVVGFPRGFRRCDC
jgi:asparaginyl-tRNA synthetase